MGIVWLKQVFERYTKPPRSTTKRLLIVDGHSSHVVKGEGLNLCGKESNGVECYSPEKSSRFQATQDAIEAAEAKAKEEREIQRAANALRNKQLREERRYDALQLNWLRISRRRILVLEKHLRRRQKRWYPRLKRLL